MLLELIVLDRFGSNVWYSKLLMKLKKVLQFERRSIFPVLQVHLKFLIIVDYLGWHFCLSELFSCHFRDSQRVGLINQEFRLFPYFFGFLKVFNCHFPHVPILPTDHRRSDWWCYPGQPWTISDPTWFREGPSMVRENFWNKLHSSWKLIGLGEAHPN